MTKFSLTILEVLSNNDISTSVQSLSIPNILNLIHEKQRKSYSTTYRHLQDMKFKKYVSCGLDDGPASTYFISDSGKQFYQSHFNREKESALCK